jgi:hypothetical protein
MMGKPVTEQQEDELPVGNCSLLFMKTRLSNIARIDLMMNYREYMEKNPVCQDDLTDRMIFGGDDFLNVQCARN